MKNLPDKAIALFENVLQFVLFTSLFSAFCALSLCMATERLILQYIPPVWSALHLLIAGSTLVIYNVHYLVKKSAPDISDQYAWVSRYRYLNYSFLSIGLLLCVVFVWQMPAVVWQFCMVLGLLAFAYSLPVLPFKNKHRLKDTGWLKIIILAAVWTAVTALLPMLFWKQDPFRFPFELLLRFVFLFILCLAFDIRDMQVDLEAGIYTLPNKIGLRNTYRLILLLTFLFVSLGFFQYWHFGIMDRLLLLIFTAFFTLWGIHYVRKYPSDRNYLLFVDGQMLLNGLLLLIL